MTEILNACRATSKGEQRLANLLQNFDDQNLLLAFTIDFIPGCREIDLLLTDTERGLFFIEVKAVPLRAFKSISPNEWVIEHRDTTESPLRQAYAQLEGFRAHWQARMHSKFHSTPACATTCFPEISRNEWLRAFPSASYAASIVNGLIFREDLIDASALRNRLSIAMEFPAIRKGRKPQQISNAYLQELRSLFKSSTPQVATLSDRMRLEAIERQITKELLKDFPPDGSSFSYFTGHPGTGKTFRLLSVGSAHAYAGKRVLFACFNKTLATDIRRLLMFNEKLAHTTHHIDTADIFLLAKRAFEINGFSYMPGQTEDEWGSLVVDELKNNKDHILDKYDTLLIDEAHDLKDWQLELLELHAKPGATICLAIGKGQELYRDDSSAAQWLDQLARGKNVRAWSLRRNFRNTRAQYFAALSFHQAWPDKIDRINKVYNDIFSRGNKTPEQLDFGRDGEALTYIPIPSLPGEFENDGQYQIEILAEEYASIIKSEIEEQEAGDGFPIGILVLVPSESSVHTIVARNALDRLKTELPEISYIDYTKDENRRSVALKCDIRLCTFHSSRGLEGDRVIIFGLETIEALAQKTSVRAENLAFIALSRALFRTVLVVRTFVPSRAHPILKAIVQARQ